MPLTDFGAAFIETSICSNNKLWEFSSICPMNYCTRISTSLITWNALFQILDRVMYRVEWIKHQEREKKKLEDEKEKERGVFSDITQIN